MAILRVRVVAVLVLTILAPPLASACSCRNDTPIQKTLERYAKRAVFTARVVQAVGSVYTDANGVRIAQRAVAVVEHKYWGFPANWPPIVILEGGYMCGTGVPIGEELLVSGYPADWYGVLDISFCSRTQLLKTAVDVRTLDGALCTGAGGTLIGHAYYSAEEDAQPYLPIRGSPLRNTTLTFRDFYGKPYVTRTDKEGIYELVHVPAGPYTLDSRIGPYRYVRGGGEVKSGVCMESDVYSHAYNLTGRLIPGLDPYATVELIRPDGGAKSLTANVQPDGRFYFQAVLPGEYVLAASFRLDGRESKRTRLYYPGVSQIDKASEVRFPQGELSESFDFHREAIPSVPLPIFVEPAKSSTPAHVEIRVLDSQGQFVNQFGSSPGIPFSFAAIRGETYEISIFADWKTRLSEPVRVKAASGMGLTRIALTGVR